MMRAGDPEARCRRKLQPFYRLEDSRNRDTGGTGLGRWRISPRSWSARWTARCRPGQPPLGAWLLSVRLAAARDCILLYLR